MPVYGAGNEYTGEALARRSASVWRALKEVFPVVRAAPVNGHLLAAVKGRAKLSLEPAVLGAHWTRGLKIEAGGAEVAPEEYFQAIFGGVLAIRPALDGPDRQTAVENLEAALAHAETSANRDTQPVAMAESLGLELEVRGLFSASESAPTFAALLRAWRNWLIGVPLAGVFVWALFSTWRSRAGGRGRWWLYAFATGLFGMALEIGLLSAYQNARGHVYSEIGGITASFMAGLALGTQASRRFPRTAGALLWLTLGMIALSLAIPWAITLLAGAAGGLLAAGFWLLMIVAGFFDGAAFSLLVALASGTGADCAQAGKPVPPNFGGWAYATDLLGSAVGGLLCGTVWIPLFGLTGAMSTMAAILVMALLPFFAWTKLKIQNS